MSNVLLLYFLYFTWGFYSITFFFFLLHLLLFWLKTRSSYPLSSSSLYKRDTETHSLHKSLHSPSYYILSLTFPFSQKLFFSLNISIFSPFIFSLLTKNNQISSLNFQILDPMGNFQSLTQQAFLGM